MHASIHNKSSNLLIFIIMYHLLSKLPLIVASDLAQFERHPLVVHKHFAQANLGEREFILLVTCGSTIALC